MPTTHPSVEKTAEKAFLLSDRVQLCSAEAREEGMETASVCVCVREREKERESERKRERERASESERERERQKKSMMSACVGADLVDVCLS